MNDLSNKFQTAELEDYLNNAAEKPGFAGFARATGGSPSDVSLGVPNLQVCALPGQMVGKSDRALLEQLRQAADPASTANKRNRSVGQSTVVPVIDETPPVSPGDVVLLPPRFPLGVDRQVFVLVSEVEVSATGEKRVRLVPFSPLTFAATPREIETGLEDEALRVLCLWNAVWLPKSIVVEAWEVREVDGSRMVNMVRAAEGREPDPSLPPVDLQMLRFGAPIEDLDDRRQLYVEAEEGLWEYLRMLQPYPFASTGQKTGISAMAMSLTVAVQLPEIQGEAREYPFKAWVGETDPSRRSFTLEVRLNTRSSSLEFRILDEEEQLTKAFDGSFIVGLRGRSKPIMGGSLKIEGSHLRHGFCLVRSNGDILCLDRG